MRSIRSRASDMPSSQPVSRPSAVFVDEFLRRLEREFRVFARHQFRRVHFFDFPRTFDDLFEGVRVVVLREGVHDHAVVFPGRGFIIRPHGATNLREHASALFLLRKDLRLIIASSMSSIGLLLLLLSFDKVVGPHLRSDDVRAVRELRHEYRVRFPERLIVMLLRRGKRELLCLGAEICCGCRRVLVSRRKDKTPPLVAPRLVVVLEDGCSIHQTTKVCPPPPPSETSSGRAHHRSVVRYSSSRLSLSEIKCE